MYSTLNQMNTNNIEYFCKMTFESVMWSLINVIISTQTFIKPLQGGN